MLQRVTTNDFQARVLESDRPVLVDFTAAWCPPCRVMEPLLEAIDADRDDLTIVSVDTDSEQQLAVDYTVLSMPTFKLFVGGQEVWSAVGSRPRHKLERELDEALAARV